MNKNRQNKLRWSENILRREESKGSKMEINVKRKRGKRPKKR